MCMRRLTAGERSSGQVVQIREIPNAAGCQRGCTFYGVAVGVIYCIRASGRYSSQWEALRLHASTIAHPALVRCSLNFVTCNDTRNISSSFVLATWTGCAVPIARIATIRASGAAESCDFQKTLRRACISSASVILAREASCHGC